MVVRSKHAFTSAAPEGGDATKVRTSNWNADHALTYGPSFSAYRGTTDQSLTTANFSEILFNTEMWDTDNAHNVTNGRFTPQVAGKYQINAWLGLTAGAADISNSQIFIYKNGAVVKRGAIYVAAAGIQFVSLGVAGLVDMNGTTDYVSIFVYSNGTTPSVPQSASNNGWDGHFVRP